MKKEDYFKYYIQGSDHYLIPKDVFDELFDEMENWKEEAKELKKQLTTYQILHRDCKVDNLKNISKIEEMENQQKEFIEYLEDEKDRLIHETSHYYTDSFDRQHVVNEDMYDEVYKISIKFKEIIGGKDE